MPQIYICLGIAVVFLLAALAAFPWVILEDRKFKQKVEEAFAGRAELDDEEFYEKYFKVRGVPFYIVQKSRRIFEDELKTSLSRLLPEDDFSNNLKFFFAPNRQEDYYLAERIEDEFGFEFSEEDLTDIYGTFEESVNLIWRKVQQKHEFEN